MFIKMTQLWGEFDHVEPKDTVPAEIIKYIIMQAMQQDPLRSPPPHERQAVRLDSDISAFDTLGLDMDDRMIHSVKLIQYSWEMNDLINNKMAGDVQSSVPELPEHPIPPLKHGINHPLSFIDKEFSDFSNGIGPELPNISLETAKNILSKSVAMLMVHNGFEKTTQSVLATFTDAVEFFVRRFVMLLRIAVDQGANDAFTGFPDAIERVFTEMGLGSVRGLHDFYQKTVIKRHRDLMEECRGLSSKYENFSTKAEFQQKDDKDEVPEIHLNDLNGDDAMESANALETGYQMLQSFEQEVRSQQDSQEEGNESITLDGYDLGNYKRFKL